MRDKSDHENQGTWERRRRSRVSSQSDCCAEDGDGEDDDCREDENQQELFEWAKKQEEVQTHDETSEVQGLGFRVWAAVRLNEKGVTSGADGREVLKTAREVEKRKSREQQLAPGEFEGSTDFRDTCNRSDFTTNAGFRSQRQHSSPSQRQRNDVGRSCDVDDGGAVPPSNLDHREGQVAAPNAGADGPSSHLVAGGRRRRPAALSPRRCVTRGGRGIVAAGVGGLPASNLRQGGAEREIGNDVNGTGQMSPPDPGTGFPLGSPSPPLHPTAQGTAQSTSHRKPNPKRKSNGNWTDAELERAIADVDDGVPIRAAARSHGIPPTSLRGHLYGTTLQRRRGKPAVLKKEEEDELVDYVIKMQDLGFPLTMEQIREKAGILTQARSTPFKDGVPGPGWVRCFKKRHREIAMRKRAAESLHGGGASRSRAGNVRGDQLAV